MFTTTANPGAYRVSTYEPPPRAGLRPSGPPNDDELVQRSLAGDREAFGELVLRYQRRATSVAYRLLGNMHDALEVCQEAFVRAYRYLAELEAPARFGSWLLRIVANLSLNHRRSRGSRARRCSLEAAIIDELEVARNGARRAQLPASHPGAGSAAEELAGLIRAAIDELPDRQRTALVLFSIEQLPQREVAQIMSCSVEAVKWHVFQARKTLKGWLQPYLQS